MHFFHPKQTKFKKAWIVSTSSLLPGVHNRGRSIACISGQRPRNSKRSTDSAFWLNSVWVLTIGVLEVKPELESIRAQRGCALFSRVSITNDLSKKYLVTKVIGLHNTHRKCKGIGGPNFYQFRKKIEASFLTKKSP